MTFLRVMAGNTAIRGELRVSATFPDRDPFTDDSDTIGEENPDKVSEEKAIPGAVRLGLA